MLSCFKAESTDVMLEAIYKQLLRRDVSMRSLRPWFLAPKGTPEATLVKLRPLKDFFAVFVFWTTYPLLPYSCC